MIAKFLLVLTFFVLPDSSDIKTQTEEQVAEYVRNLEAGNDMALNLWALKEIGSINCENHLNVIKHLGNLTNSEYAKAFSEIDCEDSQSDYNELLISFLDPDIQNVYRSIVEADTLLTEDHFGYIGKEPILHLLLMTHDDKSTFYSEAYYKKVLIAWEDYLNQHNEEQGIKYSIILSQIIRAAYRSYEYEKVEKYAQPFVDTEPYPNSFEKLKVLGAIDFTYYAYGNYDKSLQLQRSESLPLARFLNDEAKINQIKTRMGGYLSTLGKYQESKEIYEELYSNSEDVVNQYTLFTNLGINYLKLGQSNKYISLQLRALNQDFGDKYTSLLNVYRNLFIYYTSIKDVNTALRYIELAKEVASQNNDNTELALIDSFLGTFYWSTYKDHNKALQYLSDAEDILNPETDYKYFVTLQLEKGEILSKIDSISSAELVFKELKDLTLSKSDTPNYVETLVNLAEINLKKDKIDQAQDFLDEIKIYSLDDLDFELLVKYYTVKSNFSKTTGRNRAAIETLRPVIDQIVERTKNNTDSQQGYWLVQDEYLDAFKLIVNLYIESEQPQEALVLLDQLKTINDASLYNSPLIKGSKLSETELVEEKRLSDKLQSLRKEYLNTSGEERFALKKEIEQTSAAREQILAEVDLDREYSIPAIWALQRNIKTDELILHFTEIGTNLYVSYLTKDDLQIKTYDFSAELREKFTQTANDLASGSTNLNHLFEIYEILDLEQIPNHQENIRTITVIPDNSLYRIPLEILPTKAPNSNISFGSSRYLIEDYSFRYFTSLKEFDRNRRSFNSPTTYDFSGFAISDFKDYSNVNLPSLPYATVETNNIYSSLTAFSDKEVYNEGRATKEAFKERVSASRLVHVATHSEVSEQDPLFSTIYLKNENPADTLTSEQALYAYELFDTSLNSEFIMLNSCSSGSGGYIQGSGVMGISRALRYAGAKSLALNLWSVNDKVASEFATDFYTYLNQGFTKNEAIRKAKLIQLQTSNANPHFWGAYMMIGNPSPVTGSTNNPFLLYSLLVLTLALTGYSVHQVNAPKY